MSKDMNIKSELAKQIIWITAWANRLGASMPFSKFWQKTEKIRRDFPIISFLIGIMKIHQSK